METPTPAVDRSIDPAYLAYQYGDAEKLRVRRETHDRYKIGRASCRERVSVYV
jgi:hypothetical protein